MLPSVLLVSVSLHPFDDFCWSQLVKIRHGNSTSPARISAHLFSSLLVLSFSFFLDPLQNDLTLNRHCRAVVIFIWIIIWYPNIYTFHGWLGITESPCGLVVKPVQAVKQKDLWLICISSPFSSEVVVHGHCSVTSCEFECLFPVNLSAFSLWIWVLFPCEFKCLFHVTLSAFSLWI